MASLVKQVDSKIEENSKLKAFVVVLTDNAAKTKDALEKAASDDKIKHVPLTLIDNLTGPSDYQIAKDAEVTVMLWVKGKVVVNHAFAADKMTQADVDKIVADIPKILD